MRSLGSFDAICGYTTVAVDFLSEELEQNSEPRDWLSRFSKGHGVVLHDVEHESLPHRLAEMFVLIVNTRFEEFLRSLMEQHAGAAQWKSRGDVGLFEHVTKSLCLTHSTNGAADRETIEYYRHARNVISHPGTKTKRLENRRTKLRKALNITEEYLPPKTLGTFDYGDFFLFTRSVKSYAAIICQAARPSDSEISIIVARNLKSLNRFRNNPQRFRNALRQLLLMDYNLEQVESDPIIDIIVGR